MGTHGTTPESPDLRERLTQLEDRVRQLEEELGIGPAWEVTETTTGVAPSPEPVVPVVPVGSDEPQADRPAPEAVQIPYQARPVPDRAFGEGGLEQTIGLKLAGAAGALVVLVGVVLGVTYAYDAGWIGGISATARLILMALSGLALIGAGELVLRRYGRRAAAGVFATGVGVLFATAYVGHAGFDLYPDSVAIVLMTLAAAVGVAVAWRADLLSVALLSQLCGHLAPVLAGGSPESPLGLLAYVLALDVAAILLAAIGSRSDTPARWWVLRWVTLTLTGGWLIVALTFGPAEFGGMVFVFATLYAGLYIVEAAWTTRRFTDAVHAGPIALATLVTVFLTATTLIALFHWPASARAGVVVALSAVYAGAVILGLRAKIDRGLALTLALLAGALLVVAVPVAFEGPAVPIGWAAMALIAGIVGVKRDLAVVRGASVVILAAAAVYVVLSTRLEAIPPDVDAMLADPLTVWSVLMGSLSLVGLVLARLMTTGGTVTAEREMAGLAVTVAAGAAWIATAIVVLPPAGATLAILVYAWLLGTGDRFAPRQDLCLQALAALGIAAGKWAFIDLLADRLEVGWSDRQLAFTALVNPMTLLGGVIACSGPGIYFLCRRRLDSVIKRLAGRIETLDLTLLTAGLFIAFLVLGACLETDRIIVAASDRWAMTFGPDRVRQLGFTALAAAGSAVLTSLAIWLESHRNEPQSRVGRLAVITVLIAIKFVIIDVLWIRIASGAAVGIPIGNPETATGLIVLGGLVLHVVALLRRPGSGVALVTVGLTTLTLLVVLGSLEVGRLTDAVGLSSFAGQVGVSLWWALAGVTCVLAGLYLRVSALRYFGLSLLGIVLIKACLIDLRALSAGWRTLSFIGVGLLFLATSVLYGKYSDRLLRHAHDTR